MLSLLVYEHVAEFKLIVAIVVDWSTTNVTIKEN